MKSSNGGGGTGLHLSAGISRSVSAAKSRGCALVTRKPIVPGAAELEENPRARSAKLRVAEKLP